MEKEKIITRCPICGETHNLYVPINEYNAWLNGELIQNAMPSLSAEDREMLISGICPNCWDKMCGL